MKRPLTIIFTILLIGGFAIALAEKRTAKLRLVVLEGRSANLEVYFNPEELTIDKSVPWQKGKSSDVNTPAVELDTPGSSTIYFESAFDLSQTNENVYQKYIRPIENLTIADEGLKRPPRVKVIWAPSMALPPFEGVLESVGVKYTMFTADGIPVRATANVRLREASKASTREDDCPEDNEDCDEPRN